MVVPVDVPENEELHVQLRNRFFDSLDDEKRELYQDVDIERLRTDDAYCKRFIIHKKHKLEEALQMVDEAFRWRKKEDIKNITAASIPIDFFQAKAVFPYNKDKEGNPIIMILVRLHRKVPDYTAELRKFVIYWVELMEEQTNGGQMTVIMSCVGAGISNLDLDLIKFLITMFRSYYPNSLAHILIYEMPWILSPAWKIIKAWLPDDFVEKIKFVNKISIQDYVSEDNLPVEMGGTNTTEYIPPTEEELTGNIIESSPKRVHFSHTESGFGNIANGRIPNHSAKGDVGHVVITDDYTIIGGILKICPASKLLFLPPSTSANDVIIKLSCVSEKPVSYKVKTNNIESYRVKPSIGVIEPGNNIEINVVLLPGFHPQPTDKFLIMAMEVADSSLSSVNLNTLWKSAPSDRIADHKLKCALKEEEQVDVESQMMESLKSMNLILKNIENKVKALDSRQASLKFQQTMSLCLAMFLSCMFLIHIFLTENSPLVSAISKYF